MRVLRLLAIILVPGALVAYGIAAAFRYVFHGESDRLTDETMRQIHRDSNQADMLRELDEIPRGRRTVIDGPPAAHRAFSREVPRA